MFSSPIGEISTGRSGKTVYTSTNKNCKSAVINCASTRWTKREECKKCAPTWSFHFYVHGSWGAVQAEGVYTETGQMKGMDRAHDACQCCKSTVRWNPVARKEGWTKSGLELCLAIASASHASLSLRHTHTSSDWLVLIIDLSSRTKCSFTVHVTKMIIFHVPGRINMFICCIIFPFLNSEEAYFRHADVEKAVTGTACPWALYRQYCHSE